MPLPAVLVLLYIATTDTLSVTNTTNYLELPNTTFVYTATNYHPIFQALLLF